MDRDMSLKDSEDGGGIQNEQQKESEHIKIISVDELNHPKLRLRQPLKVAIAEDRDGFIARYKEIDSFGCGMTEDEAVSDLLDEIVETYLDLEDVDAELGSKAQEWRKHLLEMAVLK